MESVHHTDKEIQADLDHTSNVEGSEYSYQAGTVEFKEMQAGIEFAVQITPIKDSKKHRGKMDPARDTPASSYIPDDMTETLDNKSQAEQLAISTQRGTSALQPEAYSRIGEVSSLEGMGHRSQYGRQITVADLDLEKMRLDGAMTRLRYRHEDNEKRRMHEEKMEQLRQRTASRSFGQELHELLRPQNQYALFFFCFIFIHVIYTARELAFYFIMKHHIFCFAIFLYFIFKKIFLDFKNRKK
ncbi:transmembrane protein 247-like isoform X2 [Hemicordylus capensis]|nr:transmembrane protein 247-like isoform X2 [Hemicordylus capensis]XP_053168212.1 transmembrane protein 247-like isoform X2 [Hemicordylus capensis]XP_053168221.1 transmembrane protein 247-like isoform X2 [Hemicordylus capensis]XP_053168228.1 transmembrane protein 247-like isoform X2 [Hemicordylus capensis]XP_053168238.1 transmembrane protein 247-like isoform X2 [Hemicordylus capensis]XP_053168243.1 transmembrane protein 247-like isoform X2 [Hemicordylus capensis]XP_053168249.1 transmembrane 